MLLLTITHLSMQMCGNKTELFLAHENNALRFCGEAALSAGLLDTNVAVFLHRGAGEVGLAAALARRVADKHLVTANVVVAL